MLSYDYNSNEAGDTPTDGRTSGFPSPAADYLAVDIDLNKLLIEHPSSHFKTWLVEEGKKYLVIVDRALPLNDGCQVVAWENNTWYLKRYRLVKNVVWLHAIKEDMPPVKVNADEPYTILGRVSKLIWMNP
jgi:DNA polymerase V